MQVRGATPDDARAIATIHVETWRAAYAGIIPADHLSALSIDERETRWRSSLAAPNGPTLVALREGVVVGWCTFSKSRDTDQPAETGELRAIYVAASSWGTGVGRTLWLAARSALVDEGFQEVTVWVLRDNARALRFYALAGFVLEPSSDKSIDVGGASLVKVRLRCPL